MNQVNRPVALGIDLATANVRVIAVDTDTGEIIAQQSGPLEIPGGSHGRREQSATYAQVAVRLIARVAEQAAARASDIRALSITGTSGTIVPTDETGRPVGSALMYNDGRGQDELGLLIEAGLAVRPSVALARTAWLNRHRPAPRYVFTPDIVAARLAGRLLASDTSHALKSGIDPVARQWDQAALEVLGLSGEHLPELVEPGRVIGVVAPAVSAELGLPAGVRIVAGMTDGCAAQLATGAVRIGDTVGVLGTTLVLKAVADHEMTDSRAGIYSHVSPDGAFWAGGASNVGAGSLPPQMTAHLELHEADRRAASLAAPSVICYPLTGVGERFPVVARDFAGFTIGVGGQEVIGAADADPIDRYLAVLEGVAFVERLGLERLGLEQLGALGTERRTVPAGRHHLAGGASSSRVWNEIRASVLGAPVVVPVHRDSAFGAVILAAYGIAASDGQTFSPATSDGRHQTMADIAGRLSRPADVVDPDPARSQPLEERFQAFRHELDRRGYLLSAP